MPAAPAKFAYRVPYAGGGLVTSRIEQRTDRGHEYHRRLAVLAEDNGFEYALSQVRYMASHGAEYQRESTGFSPPCCSPPSASRSSPPSTPVCGTRASPPNSGPPRTTCRTAASP